MILKKPYAFLIKHFRLIHIILAILVSYVSFSVFKIIDFFKDFINNNYTSEIIDKTLNYINIYLYLAIILIIIISSAIYTLLKKKNKKRKLYSWFIIYYIILFALVTISHGVIENMAKEIISSAEARSYRDIGLIVSIFQYAFLIITLLRSIGFDIKGFNFKKDLEEMQIESQDSEEFEFEIGEDNYKVFRKLRRVLRELKYYIKENTIIFISIIIITILSIGSLIYYNRSVYNKVYKENESIRYRNYIIEVQNSYITDKDMRGNIINKDKYYVILNMYVKNIGAMDTIRTTDFRLQLNNNIYPTAVKNEYFIDLGTPYNNDSIKQNEQKNFLLIYEIPKDKVKSNYTIKISNDITAYKGSIVKNYQSIKINPKDLSTINTIGTYSVNDEIPITDNKLKLTNYKLTKSYFYTFQKCNPDCITIKDSITSTNNYLIVLSYDLIDKKNMIDLVTNYIKLEYIYNGNSITVVPKNRTNENISSDVVFEVSSDLYKASKIDLIINKRTQKYIVNLKNN